MVDHQHRNCFMSLFSSMLKIRVTSSHIYKSQHINPSVRSRNKVVKSVQNVFNTTGSHVDIVGYHFVSHQVTRVQREFLATNNDNNGAIRYVISSKIYALGENIKEVFDRKKEILTEYE